MTIKAKFFLMVATLMSLASFGQVKYIIAYDGVNPRLSLSEARTELAQGRPYVGQIIAFDENAIPAGWLECNGDTLLIGDPYLDLFYVIGTEYGGNGTTNFVLPRTIDLGRSIQAADPVSPSLYNPAYIAKFKDSTSLEYSVLYQANDGNIGVRTTTPATAFDVNGVISTTGAFRSNPGGASYNYLLNSTSTSPALYLQNANASGDVFHALNGSAGIGSGTSRLIIKGSGNVGINKSAPAEILDIVGNLRYSGTLKPNGTAPTTGQFLKASSASANTWANIGISDVTALQDSLNSREKTITGTTNYLLKKTAGGVGDSNLFDNGSLGYGTDTPSDFIHAVNTLNDGLSFRLQNLSSNSTANVSLRLNSASTDWYIRNIRSPGHLAFGEDFFGEMMRIEYTGTIGIGTSTPNASAKLDITSTTQGFLPPRMTTTQKNAISSPAQGLMVFDTTLVKLQVYDGSSWVSLH